GWYRPAGGGAGDAGGAGGPSRPGENDARSVAAPARGVYCDGLAVPSGHRPGDAEPVVGNDAGADSPPLAWSDAGDLADPRDGRASRGGTRAHCRCPPCWGRRGSGGSNGGAFGTSLRRNPPGAYRPVVK